MTLTEFRAWLRGFCDALGRAPNEKEWSLIKEKIDTIVEVKGQVLPFYTREITTTPFVTTVTPCSPSSRPMLPAQIWCQTDDGNTGYGACGEMKGTSIGDAVNGIN